MGHNGSPMITSFTARSHIAASLITSFQPPLLATRARENAIFEFCAHAHSLRNGEQLYSVLEELGFGSVEGLKTLIVLRSAP